MIVSAETGMIYSLHSDWSRNEVASLRRVLGKLPLLKLADSVMTSNYAHIFKCQALSLQWYELFMFLSWLLYCLFSNALSIPHRQGLAMSGWTLQKSSYGSKCLSWNASVCSSGAMGPGLLYTWHQSRESLHLSKGDENFSYWNGAQGWVSELEWTGTNNFVNIPRSIFPLHLLQIIIINYYECGQQTPIGFG